MDLSIIIPLYNEAKAVRISLEKLLPFLTRHFQNHFELILVDDNSVDKTLEEVNGFVESFPDIPIQTIQNQVNRGKGYSIARGIKKAQGQWIFFMDADLSTPLEFIVPFVEQLKKGADIVIASRFEKNSKMAISRSPLLRFLSWSERQLIRAMAGLSFSDTQCGFKGFRASVAKKLFAMSRIKRFCFDVELLFLAKRFGFKIETLSVQWSHHRDSKVRWQDPFIFVLDLLKIRWYALQGYYKL